MTDVVLHNRLFIVDGMLPWRWLFTWLLSAKPCLKEKTHGDNSDIYKCEHLSTFILADKQQQLHVSDMTHNQEGWCGKSDLVQYL